MRVSSQNFNRCVRQLQGISAKRDALDVAERETRLSRDREEPRGRPCFCRDLTHRRKLRRPQPALGAFGDEVQTMAILRAHP